MKDAKRYLIIHASTVLSFRHLELQEKGLSLVVIRSLCCYMGTMYRYSGDHKPIYKYNLLLVQPFRSSSYPGSDGAISVPPLFCLAQMLSVPLAMLRSSDSSSIESLLSLPDPGVPLSLPDMWRDHRWCPIVSARRKAPMLVPSLSFVAHMLSSPPSMLGSSVSSSIQPLLSLPDPTFRFSRPTCRGIIVGVLLYQHQSLCSRVRG